MTEKERAIASMYRDTRPVQVDANTASTPEMWAARFAGSTRMNPWRSFLFSRTREWALIRRHVPHGATILDAGCGFGEWVSFLDGKGYRAQGLDYSDELVSRLGATYPDLVWKVGDIRRMPYAEGTFDAIISWGVIEHDEAGPAETLREFGRILKPGGIAIVTVPLDSDVQRRSAAYLYHRGSGKQAFFQYFMTEEDLAVHIRAAAFDVVDQGVLPNAIIDLVAPALAARLRGFSYRFANFLVSTFMSWIPRYCVMRYCVASKRRRVCGHS